MKNVFRAITVAVILTLALSACGGGGGEAPAPTSGPIVVNTPVSQPDNAAPTVASSVACNNPYWPINAGARWAYTSTGSPAGAYEFGMLVHEVRADGFTVRASFKKNPSPQEWMCLPEGLVPLNMVANNATSILAFRKFQDSRLSNVVGVYLPASIAPGQTWTFEFDFTATQMEEGVALPVSGHIKYDFTAGNNENVTVPAGSYDALPITVVATIKFSVTTAAGAEENDLTSSYTYWYAPNVGWVKASGSGKLGGLEFFESLELIGYAAQ